MEYFDAVKDQKNIWILDVCKMNKVKIKFLDLLQSYNEIKYKIDSKVSEVLNSGHYINGAEVAQFEGEYAQWVGSKYCIGVGNGLDAITTALMAMGIGDGDEVIVPGNTFIATWLAVTRVGAIPVSVDPEWETCNIDPTKIESMISKKTKAIIIVHLYGLPAKIDEIMEIARKYNLRVIEDAAQAHGAKYKGVRIGKHADIIAWSFYPGKNLGAFGDAGAVTTDNQDLAEKIRLISNYGSKRKYEHLVMGLNTRLDELQAGVLRVKLTVLEEWNQRRRAIAKIYSENINQEECEIPFESNEHISSWHLYVVKVDPHKRNQIVKKMIDSGIEVLMHYPIPPEKQLAYAGKGFRGGSQISEELAKSVISLPIGPHMPISDAEKVVAIFNTAIGKTN
jgi:dTDP-4-amino-4,6-dideoxygalactose transaminase